MILALLARQFGNCDHRALQRRVELSRTIGCTELQDVEILRTKRQEAKRRRREQRRRQRRSNVSAVTCLNFSSADDRYLLSGAIDSTIAIYDVERKYKSKKHSEGEEKGESENSGRRKRKRKKTRRKEKIEPLFVMKRQTDEQSGRQRQRGGDYHRGCITSLQWWPVDTGTFLSSSMDGTVKLWDTNALQVATEFAFAKSHVYTAALSSIATQHTLIAVGTGEKNVHLCDLVSGSAAHVLMGHESGIWAAAWSPTEEYVLATGEQVGAVKLWDVRRAGKRACLASFDMRRTAMNDRFSSSRTRAHDGSVTGIRWLPDGCHLLTSGSDSRVRLWDRRGHRLHSHYDGTANNQRKGSGFAVCGKRRKEVFVFCPNGKNIRGFNVMEPEQYNVIELKGHFSTVNTVTWRGSSQSVWSGGDDGLILTWKKAEREKKMGKKKDSESGSDDDE
eukprot:g1443.t1